MIQIKLFVMLGVFLALRGVYANVIQNEDLCKDPSFDTMFDTPDGKVYIFKKDKYYELQGTTLGDGPKPISDKWEGLPDSIDGAFSQNGTTFFFKNGRYWRFTEYKMDQSYPKRLSATYSEIPKKIDDVTVGIDGKVYFFAGRKVYRMDEFNEKSTTVMIEYISDGWKDIPNHCDAVHYSRIWGITFFFKNDKFYAFGSGPAYPIPTTSYFFDCQRI
ncbi:hypothetical protein HA402_002038 [Bradysia odoriphaga]|nr:hypothetical protein HA402_002038 [Bradysia odoriphaga]